jgi:hypothetical protein
LSELIGAPVPGIIEWTRQQAEMATAPRASVNDTSTYAVTLKAPEGISHATLMSGRSVLIPADRLVAMTVEDSKPMIAAGWSQNNLERCV